MDPLFAGAALTAVRIHAVDPRRAQRIAGSHLKPRLTPPREHDQLEDGLLPADTRVAPQCPLQLEARTMAKVTSVTVRLSQRSGLNTQARCGQVGTDRDLSSFPDITVSASWVDFNT